MNMEAPGPNLHLVLSQNATAQAVFVRKNIQGEKQLVHLETDKLPFSKLAALIKLHVACKLENKDFTLTDLRQKVFGMRAGCRCRSVKVNGMLIFFGIILTALRLQSHRSIQHSIDRCVSNPETFLRLSCCSFWTSYHFAFNVEQFNISEESLKSSHFHMASTSKPSKPCASIALSKLSDA